MAVLISQKKKKASIWLCGAGEVLKGIPGAATAKLVDVIYKRVIELYH